MKRLATLLRLLVPLAALWAAAAPALADPRFAPPREEPALLGHGAEAAMREAADEARVRRLFFEPAVREIGEAGVACDHRAARRPETVAGRGRVSVLLAPDGRVLVRRWTAPDAAVAGDDESVLRAAARAAGLDADGAVETRVFAWCR